MILVIDSYDSFTYNLVQYLGTLGAEVVVHRNDAITAREALALGARGIVLGPGPRTPAHAGICKEVVRLGSGRVPVLGVCLGHQCIGEVFGGRVVRAERLMHGKTSRVHHHGTGIFAGLENPFVATRYHSLVVDPSSIPGVLRVSAWTREGEIMGLEHVTHETWGVQFHPESILTTEGMTLLRRFVDRCREARVPEPVPAGAGPEGTGGR